MPWSGSYLRPKKELKRYGRRGREGQAEEGRLGDAGDAVGPVGDVGPIEQHDADDLAEGERDDGEIVASKPEHREAEHDAPKRRRGAGDRQADPKAQAEMRGEQREGIGADGIEGDIAEVEQPGEADDDVQPPAEHDIGEHQDRQIEQIAERQAEMERLLQDVGGDREEDGEGDAANREDARVRQVREKNARRSGARARNGQEGEHASAHELTGSDADDDADDEEQHCDGRSDGEHADVAPLERLAGEQLGERRDDRVVAVPDE